MITINLEQRHIDNGVRGSCSRCPIALAVKEQFNASIVDVFGGFCQIYYENGNCEFYFHNADNFIKMFDASMLVKPREILLSKPGER